MSTPSPGLWRHARFLRLWAGQAASIFGSRVGGFAFDLTAVLTLHASAGPIAVLNGCILAPPAFVGLWVGLWADRLPRRALLLLADVGRALAFLSVPVAALTHMLTMLQLDLVAAVASMLTVLFDVSYCAYLPAVVGPENLVQANSMLQATDAVGEAGGWSIAGILVQLFTAPLVIITDSISFLISAVSIAGLGADACVVRPETSRHWRADLQEGIRFIRHDRIVFGLVATAIIWDLIGNMIGVVILLFFVRDLQLTPGLLGPLTAVGGISAFGGALVARRALQRFGLARTLIGSLYFDSLGLIAVAAAAGPLAVICFLMVLGQLTDAGRTVYEIHSRSLLQGRIPEHLAGRVNAALETFRSAGMMLGLVAGGILGQTIGLRPTLFLAIAGNALVPLVLVSTAFSRSMHPHPGEQFELLR